VRLATGVRRWTAAAPAAGLATGVALTAVAAHAQSAWFSFTDLDDRDLVVDDHAFLARPGNLVRALWRTYMHVVDPAHAYYRPLVTVSYGLDAQWSGVHPFGYHLTNIALHAVASVLFLAVLRRFALPRVVSALGAVAFAVHPALSAAVAWIPGRNDSLLAVFSLAAWLCFLRDRARPSRAYRALHLGLFALALLTKETAVALPFVWLLQVVLVDASPPGDSSRPGAERGRAHGPGAIDHLRKPGAIVYLCAWGVLVGAAVLVHHGLSDGMSAVSARTLAASPPLLFASLGKVVFPLNPTVLAAPEDFSPWPGVIAALGIGAGARWVHGVNPRVVVFGLSMFVLLLVPVLAVAGTLVLDNRLYLPACGVLLAIAEIVRAAAFDRAEPVEPRLLVGLSAVVGVVLVAITAGYEGSFRNRRTFARAAVDGAPHSPLAHFCLGKVYQTDGDEDRAMSEYEASLALGPGEVVHNNIAVIHMAHARWTDAERELREELSFDPRYARAYENLAIVLRREGRSDEAAAAGETARRLEAD
jgi:protein O-mannosyl-transferase